ncbi:unnamed protein product, partial [Ostreobium quekettii]
MCDSAGGDPSPDPGRYASLFSLGAEQAVAYARFRPMYPERLYDEIYDFAKLPVYEAALDVGTGSGQAALALARRFERVVATDLNERQLAQAPTVENVTYRQGTAETLDFADDTFDLVTIAQALHWFDLRRFYAEATRVLKPHGTLAAWVYERTFFDGNPAANEAMHDILTRKLGPYWADKCDLVHKR